MRVYQFRHSGKLNVDRWNLECEMLFLTPQDLGVLPPCKQ